MAKTFEVLFVFLRLGVTSFGGPIAHLSYFHDEFVKKRHWMNEHAYADLVALCQFLPGPASSQVGMALGLSRAGILGAIAAWIGFTLPSAIGLILFGLGLSHIGVDINSAWLHGLKIAAVAVVAQAVWSMGTKLCPDKERVSIAILAAVITLVFPSAWIQLVMIFMGGLIGILYLKTSQELPHTPINTHVSHKVGLIFLSIFFGLLFLFPFLAKSTGSQTVALFDSFFRAGSLVFGGGHVVLPLLQSEVVPPGWVSNDLFMAGYGAAQAVPGPLFSFSAYLGAVSKIGPSGWTGGFVCLISAFLPSFLLVVGAIPFWEKLRRLSRVRWAMQGINAAVVGLLLSALYNPVWTSAIHTNTDLGLGLICFLILTFWKTPSWIVVLFSAVAGGLIL